MNIFKHKNLVIQILFIVATMVASPASAYVGKVVYGYGDNHAFDVDGNRRDMRKGSKINEGDTLVTGRGRMHIRLIDGGFVSIYPNSEYLIEQFKYSGSKVGEKDINEKKESKKDRGFFSLLKGAARQVTGLLGRTYNDNFKFKTTVATIGIRGTGFFAKLCQGDCFDAEGNPLQDGLHVKNNTGIITVKTDVGEVKLAQGQSAFAASSKEHPQQIVHPPVAYNLVTPDIELYDFDEKVLNVSGEEIVDGGGVTPVVPVSPPFAVTHMEYSVIEDKTFAGPLNGFDLSDGISSLQQNGDAIDHFETEVFTDGIEQVVFDMGAATLADSGKDVALGVVWNRWQGRYTHTQFGSPVTALDQNMHIIGSADLTQNLPTSGILTYSGTGGTTSFAGATGNQVGTQTINAAIDFQSMDMLQLDITSTFADATVSSSLQFSSLGINSIVGASGSQFSMIGSCNDTGGGCGGNGASLRGAASLHIVGSAAEGIYGIYNLSSGTGENAIAGSYFATDSPLGVQQ